MDGVVFNREAAGRISKAVKTVERLPINLVGQMRVRKNKSGSGADYSGPFAVAKLTDTSVEVLGYSEADSQYWNNYIISGLTRIEVADGANVTGITVSGYLYVGITHNGSTYVATLAHAAALPAQDTTHVYVPLAFIVCADSKISSIQQIRQGIIEFPARAG